MTPFREAIVLPVLFVTVVLLGGLRVSTAVHLLPPSLTALVLAVLLLGTLTRGGVLVPHALMNGARSGLENVSGAVVLVTLFAASAQAINLLLPERGLLHAAFAIFLFCQIMTMHAAGVRRTGLLRSLVVLVGSMFVLRFIVVEALYAPEGGLLKRVLTALMSGATLGGVVYEPNASITGYVAFFTLLLYMSGLVLLPAALPPTTLVPRPHGPGLPATLPLLILTCLVGCRPDAAEAPDESKSASAPAVKPTVSDDLVTPEQRESALRRAQVWRAPAVPVGQANLARNTPGPGSFRESDEIECRLVVKEMSGTTPKFDCEVAEGNVIRVKYGRGNPELYSEVATTRLLAALGFGADRVHVVGKIRCAGCPSYPFHSLRCLAETKMERTCFPRGIDYSRQTDFEDAVVERKLEGRAIESTPDQGWAWFELDRIAPAAGGAPRAHVDALRLLAVFIAHWDNKAENQRLVCLPGGDMPDGGCSRPVAILQDVGASFGPVKLDLHTWRELPVWSDARTCRVSMEQLPWGGGTFPSLQISEEGRLFLLKLLEQLSNDQLSALFKGAGVEQSETITAEGRKPAAWAAAFADKVRQIRDGGPCPAL